MLRIDIPGHPNYIINERGQVFHKETKEFIELLEGKYTLHSPEGKVRISYDEVIRRIEEAKRIEASHTVKGPAYVKHETVAVEKPKKIEEPKEDEPSGKFTLIEAVEKCGGFAPLEEIVEANRDLIDVDLTKIKKFRDQKKAVLKALKKK